MPKVICNDKWCRYWSEDGCVADEVRFLFDGQYEGACQTYENYVNAPEYLEKFWLRWQADDGSEMKVALNGKRMEYKGRIFYTRDNVRIDGNYEVVDGATGICIGTYADLEERYDDLLRFEKIVKKLEDLPEHKNKRQETAETFALDPFEKV